MDGDEEAGEGRHDAVRAGCIFWIEVNPEDAAKPGATATLRLIGRAAP
jgi:hypothetical protein